MHFFDFLFYNSRQSIIPSPISPSSRNVTHYAVVQFDFFAERPDELTAKAGEPIIIIAQSNHEWFVAKPIMRLGGPGLIPVAFVELRDQKTNQAIDTNQIIQSGLIPRVEDWKKQAAEYKKASIPLGRFEFDQKTHSQSNTIDESYHQNNEANHDSGINENESLNIRSIVEANVGHHYHENEVTWYQLNAVILNDESKHKSLLLFRLYEDFYDFQIRLLDTFPIEAGRKSIDNSAPNRILPFLPGPIEPHDLNEETINNRRLELNQYAIEISNLPENIIASTLVNEFLSIRPGDKITDIDFTESKSLTNNNNKNNSNSMHSSQSSSSFMNGPRTSQQPSRHSQQRSQQLSSQSQQQQLTDGRLSNLSQNLSDSLGVLSIDNYNYNSKNNDTAVKHQSNEYHDKNFTKSESNSILDINKLASESTLSTTVSNNNNSTLMKVKVLHQSTGDLIALRISPNEIKLVNLVNKVKDRIGCEINHIWINEGENRKEITNDDELNEWINSGVKLSLIAA